MLKLVRRTTTLLALVLLAAGCWSKPNAPTFKSPEEQIAALPWPADGLYGVAHDGYLAYFEDEPINIQVSFIHVTRWAGPKDFGLRQVSIVTEDGRVHSTQGCQLLQGTRTASYTVWTASCNMLTNIPRLYKLKSLRVETADRVWELPTGNVAIEVLAGTYLRDVFVSRWHLQNSPDTEYRALLVNDGATNWIMVGFSEAVERQRLGRVVKVQWGPDYAGSTDSFQEGRLRLKSHSSLALRVVFAHEDTTMAVLRPAVLFKDEETGTTRMVTLQTTFYTPPLSPRDVLAFTQNPNHLRSIRESLSRPTPSS